MKIFVTGLTSTGIGGMEWRNLGNYIIIEPFFENLRKTFPEAEISTSLQLSDRFCETYKLNKRSEQRFWRYGTRTALSTLLDSFLLMLCKFTTIKWFLRSPMLREISRADLIIDFSGDIYGDNAGWNKFLETNVRLFFALILKKQIAMVIGSPGPFKSFWRQWIARRILPKLKLVTNREPISTAMLAYVGIKGPHIHSTVCPSVLFNKAHPDTLPKNQDWLRLSESPEPVVGFILCGWNMPSGPYNKWPREDSDFDAFVDLIRHIKSTTSYRICLMAHQNATDEKMQLQKGGDHRIISKLAERLGQDFDQDKIFTLEGIYDAATIKTLIGKFDLVISGRIHGAVQALSQSIPTMILDYGHEPKPHKLLGFSVMYGVYDYFVSPNEIDAMKSCFDTLDRNKPNLKQSLNLRVPALKKEALEHFKLLGELKPQVSSQDRIFQ